MNRIFIAAAAIMLAAPAGLAQTYGGAGLGPRYQNQYNGPGWERGAGYGGSLGAYAQSPGGGRSPRGSSVFRDPEGDLIGRNPVLPGRW
jgi:hypothetical protein